MPGRRRPSPPEAEQRLHDIASPALAASGWIALICDSGLDPGLRRWAERARQCVDEINRLLRPPATEAAYAPMEEVEQQARALALRAAESGTRLLCSRRPGGPWRVSGRLSALRRILSNLAGNALRHAPGGCVEIELGLRRARGGWILRLEVRDEGSGIERGLAGRLFKAGARRRGSPGKGLGLHIVRRLCREGGGEAGAWTSSKGSVFWAELLVQAEPGEPPAPRPGRPVAICGGPPRQRRWLARLLAGWGVPCAEIPLGKHRSGLAAAARAMGGEPLVISDLPPGEGEWSPRTKVLSLGDNRPCGPGDLCRLLDEANGWPGLRKDPRGTA